MGHGGDIFTETNVKDKDVIGPGDFDDNLSSVQSKISTISISRRDEVKAILHPRTEISHEENEKLSRRHSLPIIPSSKDYSTPFGSMPLYEITEGSEEENQSGGTVSDPSLNSMQRRHSTGSISKKPDTAELAEFLRTTGPSDFFGEKHDAKSKRSIKRRIKRFFGLKPKDSHEQDTITNNEPSRDATNHKTKKDNTAGEKRDASKNRTIKSSLFRKRSSSLDSIYTSKGRKNYRSQVYELNKFGNLVFKDPNYKPISILRPSISEEPSLKDGSETDASEQASSSMELEAKKKHRRFSLLFFAKNRSLQGYEDLEKSAGMPRKKSVKVIAPSHRDIIYVSDDEEYQDARRGYTQQFFTASFSCFLDENYGRLDCISEDGPVFLSSHLSINDDFDEYERRHNINVNSKHNGVEQLNAASGLEGGPRNDEKPHRHRHKKHGHRHRRPKDKISSGKDGISGDSSSDKQEFQETLYSPTPEHHAKKISRKKKGEIDEEFSDWLDRNNFVGLSGDRSN